MLLLGAGPRALLLQIAHPSVAAGVDEHSDFRADPWRRLRGTLRELPGDHLRVGAGGAGGDPPAQRAAPRHHRAGLCRPRPGARAVGPRHAGGLHDRGQRRVARAAGAGPRGRVLRGDAPDRPGVRDPRGAPPRGPRRVRRVRRRDARAGRPGPVGPLARELAETILRPPLPGCSPGSASRRRPMPGPSGRRWASCHRPSARRTACHGTAADRVVADWLVTGWRAWRPLLPASLRQMPQALAADRRVCDDPRPDDAPQ